MSCGSACAPVGGTRRVKHSRVSHHHYDRDLCRQLRNCSISIRNAQASSVQCASNKQRQTRKHPGMMIIPARRRLRMAMVRHVSQNRRNRRVHAGSSSGLPEGERLASRRTNRQFDWSTTRSQYSSPSLAFCSSSCSRRPLS